MASETSTEQTESTKGVLRKLWAREIGVATPDVKEESNFFELGGDSAIAMRLVAAARNENLDLRIQSVYNNPKYKDMVQQVQPADTSNSKGSSASTDGTEQLSNANLQWTWGVLSAFQEQTGLDVDQIEDVCKTGRFQVITMPMMFQMMFKLVQGTVDQVKHALDLVQDKVPLLRARCVQYEKGYYHFIAKPAIPLHEKSGSAEDYQNEDQKYSGKIGQPLSRIGIIHEGEDVYVLWTLSHAIQDRPTRTMLVQELKEALQDPASYAAKEPIPLPREFMNYSENVKDEALKHWIHVLHGAPKDQPLKIQEEPASRQTTQILKHLQHSSSPDGSILFATLTNTVWMITLAKHGTLDDVVITTARSGRAIPLPKIEQFIGCCATIAPIRARFQPQQTLLSVLQRVQQSIVEGLPYEAWGGVALAKHHGRTPCHIFSHSPPDQATFAGFMVETTSSETGGPVKLELTIPVRKIPWATYVEVAPGVEGGSMVKAIFDEVCFPKEDLEDLLSEFMKTIDTVISNEYRLFTSTPWEQDQERPKTTYRDSAQSRNDTAIILPDVPAHQENDMTDQSGTTITQAQLTNHISTIQDKLASLGITKDIPVAMALPNSYEIIVAFLATTSQRGIAAPLNPKYKESEFDFYIDDLRPKILLIPKNATTEAAIRSARKHNVAVAELSFDGRDIYLDIKEGNLPHRQVERAMPKGGDLALILHTSGTTGRPKAVPLTHANIMSSVHNIVETYLLTPEDRTMLIMPLFHIHGLVASFLSPLFSGGTIILPSQLSPQFWSTFACYGATWYTGTPTNHSIILSYDKPSPVPDIRFIRSCSSPLSPALFDRIEREFGAPVVESYAMTETSHMMTSNPLPPGRRRPGTVGQAQGNIELRILNDKGEEVKQGQEGEVCIRAPSVTHGYLFNSEANSKAFTTEGFFRTGDQGKVDADGYLTLTGRLKEFVNKGGEKISPVELDNIISQHEAVQEVVCFAMEDELYGQDIGCAVRVKDGEVGEVEVKAWARERVNAFKVPKRVWIVEEIPKTATGKVQRRMVAEKVAGV